LKETESFYRDVENLCSSPWIYSGRYLRHQILMARSLIRKRMSQRWRRLGRTYSSSTNFFCGCWSHRISSRP